MTSDTGVLLRWLDHRQSLLSLVRATDSPSQVARLAVQQNTPTHEQVGAGIGRLDPVAAPMRQGRLDHLPGEVRLTTNSVKVFTGLYLYRMERYMVPHRSPSINAVSESVLLHEYLQLFGQAVIA